MIHLPEKPAVVIEKTEAEEKNIFRKMLMNYIRKNDAYYSALSLADYSDEQLLLIKVGIELEKERTNFETKRG